MIVKPAAAGAAFRALAPSTVLVLCFGPDEALARDLARQAIAASGIDADDPFASTTLAPEQLSADPARLLDEVQAQSFLGGRKLIVALGLSDAAAAAIEAALADGLGSGNLVVATAGDLPKRSKLRAAAEASPRALAIACYPDARGTAQLLGEECRAHGLRLDEQATELVLAAVGGERGILRQEVEKLALYVGAGQTATRADVEAVIAGVAQASHDRLLGALFDGDARDLDAALAEALSNGEAMVALLRAAQRRTLQLMRLRIMIAEGSGAAEAARQVQPPLFWKEQDRVAAQARRLSYAGLEDRLARLIEAEISVKTGGGDSAGASAFQAISLLD